MSSAELVQQKTQRREKYLSLLLGRKMEFPPVRSSTVASSAKEVKSTQMYALAW